MIRAFLGLPHNGPVAIETAEAILRFASRQEGWFEVGRCSGSSAAANFNETWRMALNAQKEKKYTHYVSIHHDVVDVDPWWMDAMVGELEAHNADYCCVPLPIKNMDGLSAIGALDLKTRVVCRFTMAELDRMPETFMVPPGQVMMAGTGLAVARFGPWARRVWFENRDRILYVTEDGRTLSQHVAANLEDAGKLPEGEYVVANWTEDWNLSLMMAHLGLKVICTRKVKCKHRGTWQWPNYLTNGEWLPRDEWKSERTPIDARWIMDLHRKEREC